MSTTPSLFKPLSHQAAGRFLERHAYTLRGRLMDDPFYFPQNKNLRCVDGRKRALRKDLQEIAFPGGALGFGLGLFGYVNTLEVQCDLEFGLKGDDITAVAERRFGGPLHFHSDEDSVKSQALDCQGCGHCNLVLNTAGTLSEGACDYLRTKYIPRLLKRKAKREVYAGDHNESALFVVKPIDVGLESGPMDGDGPNAFVYHAGWAKIIAAQLVADLLRGPLRKAAPQITYGPLSKLLWKAKKKQIENTVATLAKGRPVYYVKRDRRTGKIIFDTNDTDCGE